MAETLVELRGRSRRVRVCPRCRREWSVTREMCPECAVWIGDAERERAFTHVVIDGPALRRRLAQPPRLAGPRIRAASTLVLHLRFEGRPAGGAHDVLEERLVGFGQVLASYGGRVGSTPIGDLRAIFTGEHHALRALKAAFAVVGAQAASPTSGEDNLAIRIGINTGLAVRGRGGEPGGRSLEIAAELAWLARPGTVLASEAVFRHAAPHFDMVGVGVEGDGAPESPRYAVLGPKAVDSHALHEGHAGPLVGRERELSALDASLAALGRDESRVVSLIAEPGGGKSKLLTAWLDAARARGALDGTTTLRGLGVAYGSGPGTTLSSLLDSSSQSVSGDVMALVERGAFAPPAPVAHALADWLAGQPRALLIVDDLHWADEASLAVLRSLVERPPPVPLLVVFAFRPSSEGRLRWARAASQAVLRLPPLSAAASRHLVEARGGSEALPPALLDEVIARARGNALYLEEALAFLREGEARTAAELEARLAELPETLAELVLARVEEFARSRAARLSHGAGWLAEQRFERQRMLGELAATERELSAWLDRLETGDYADQVTIARCLRRLEGLDFELLLARMLIGEPRPRSARLATAITRLGSGSGAAHLALLRDRLRQDPANVAHEAVSAGDQAWARGDVALARAYFEIALGASPVDAKGQLARGPLHRRLAEAAQVLGDQDAARSALTAGLAEVPASARAEGARFERQLAELALATGDLAGAEAHLTRAQRGTPAREIARWCVAAAILRRRQGRVAAAERLARRAWGAAEHDDWAAVRAAVVLAGLTPRRGHRREWLLQAARRAPDDSGKRELDTLANSLAMLAAKDPGRSRQQGAPQPRSIAARASD